jgi:hypothetical protein
MLQKPYNISKLIEMSINQGEETYRKIWEAGWGSRKKGTEPTHFLW